jgi:hypothetical protein
MGSDEKMRCCAGGGANFPVGGPPANSGKPLGIPFHYPYGFTVGYTIPSCSMYVL